MGLRILGLWCDLKGLGGRFKVQGLGCREQSLGFRFEGFGHSVEC